jgi:hypothetical protein
MALDFCTRTTRRIRKIGHAPKTAVRIARFCYVSMMSVCCCFGFCVTQSGQILADTGSGIIAAGPRALLSVPAFSCIHR